MEQELEKVQQERDTNRARLLSYIYNGMIFLSIFNEYIKCTNLANTKKKIHKLFLLAEREADNVIKEFLRNSEEERQSQAELLEREKQEEMQLLSSCHSEQFMLRTKDTLGEYRTQSYVKLRLFTYEYKFVLQFQWRNCWRRKCVKQGNGKSIPNIETTPYNPYLRCQ